jgi:hypothetical protein
MSQVSINNTSPISDLRDNESFYRMRQHRKGTERTVRLEEARIKVAEDLKGGWKDRFFEGVEVEQDDISPGVDKYLADARAKRRDVRKSNGKLFPVAFKPNIWKIESDYGYPKSPITIHFDPSLFTELLVDGPYIYASPGSEHPVPLYFSRHIDDPGREAGEYRDVRYVHTMKGVHIPQDPPLAMIERGREGFIRFGFVKQDVCDEGLDYASTYCNLDDANVDWEKPAKCEKFKRDRHRDMEFEIVGPGNVDSTGKGTYGTYSWRRTSDREKPTDEKFCGRTAELWNTPASSETGELMAYWKFRMPRTDCDWGTFNYKGSLYLAKITEIDESAKKRWERMVVLTWLMFIPMMRMEYERPLTPPRCYREPTKPCYGHYDPEVKSYVDYTQGQHYRYGGYGYGGYGCSGYRSAYYPRHYYTEYAWKWCYDREKHSGSEPDTDPSACIVL